MLDTPRSFLIPVLGAALALSACGSSSEPTPAPQSQQQSHEQSDTGLPYCDAPQFKSTPERAARADAEGGMKFSDGDAEVALLPGDRCELHSAPDSWPEDDRVYGVDR